MLRPMVDMGASAAHRRYLQETVDGAAGVLKGLFGRPVDLQIERSFREPNYRAAVLRCRVLSADNGEKVPGSVIIKRFRGERGEPYDPADSHPTGARARLLNEWAGARFLQSVGSERPFGPDFYGADARLGLVLLEDLDEGECLADHLQADDPVQAERALLAYATTLGRLHASTAGRQESYAALHGEVARGGADPKGAEMVRTWLTSGPQAFRQACAALDLPISSAAEVELEALPRAVADAGPFLAYSVGDTCPDNHRYVRDDPDYLRFYDLEFGGFQHALLDAAYLWMPFPTCWCVARLPEELPPRLEAAYRAELVRGCPVAADDLVFQRALTEACAVWFVLTVAWSLVDVLERDEPWGISTVRQRFPLRASNFVRLTERSHHLPALGALAWSFAERLRTRWGDEAEMPLYRPFRDQLPL